MMNPKERSCATNVGGVLHDGWSPHDREDASVIVASVMTDHPAWVSTDAGIAYRAVRYGSSVWVLTSAPANFGGYDTTSYLVLGTGDPPVADVADPITLTCPPAVARPLQELGTVARWRNPDLWDALATTIVRQVIRAGQARKLYRSFCQAHGEQVITPHGETWLFPVPEVVLSLPDAEFVRWGMAFNRRPLLAAAQASLEFGQKWAEFDPTTLVDELQSVPRIGPWTARASVADLTNDYILYPFADLAVRTWAKLLAPGRTWPETEPEFAAEWQRLAGDQLSTMTLLTLAWGVQHVRNTEADELRVDRRS
jgi:DNA-3-methyladenine glycosylase II